MFTGVSDHENATYLTAPYRAGILSPNAEASGGSSVGYWLLIPPEVLGSLQENIP